MLNNSTINAAMLSLQPPANPKRWVPRQKQQVLACILAGKLGFQEALARYKLSVDELTSWYAEHRTAVVALIY